MMTPQALAFLQSLKEVEAGAQEAMTLNHQRDADDIRGEDMICHGKSHCLPKWSSNSASFTAPRRIVGALLLLLLIGGGTMIESYGRRYGIYTGMNSRGFGGGFLGSKD